MRQRLFPGNHPDVANSLNNVAWCLESLGRLEEAMAKFEEATEMYGHVLPIDHWRTRVAAIGKGCILVSLERFEEASAILFPLCDAVVKNLNVPTTYRIRCRDALADLSDAVETTGLRK